MKFEIPFNESIYRKQVGVYFDHAWKDHLKKNKRNFYWGIPAILLGGLVVFSDGNYGYVMIAIGLHYVIVGSNFYSGYKNSKKTYFDAVNSEITAQLAVTENAIWEFDEASFNFKYYLYEIKMKWESFIGYRLIDNILFLDMEEGNNASYILSEDEIGSVDFTKVVDFVKEKIKPKIDYL
jgi:hypothetical protein